MIISCFALPRSTAHGQSQCAQEKARFRILWWPTYQLLVLDSTKFTKQAYKGPKANGGNTLGGTALYELLRTSTCHPSVLQEKPCLRQVMSLAAVWPPWR